MLFLALDFEQFLTILAIEFDIHGFGFTPGNKTCYFSFPTLTNAP
jgi:hypothetical protein